MIAFSLKRYLQGEDSDLDWLIVSRISLSFFILIILILFQIFRQNASDEMMLYGYGVLGFSFLVSLIEAQFLDKIPHHSRSLVLHLIFDAVVITLCILSFGGRENILSLLFLIYIMVASFVLHQRGAYFASILSALLLGWVVSRAPQSFPNPFFSWSLYSMVFVSFGFLATVFSQEIIKNSQKLKEFEKNAKQNEKLAAIGQLAAGIAHEIRNPLASMSASLQMLKTTPEGLAAQESQKLMEISLKEIDRLNRLISEFLEYVRPSKFQFERVELKSVLAEVAHAPFPQSKFQYQIVEKFESDVFAKANLEKIKQILWNFVINSIQALDKPGIIELGCAQVDETTVKFWVKDNGTGMDERALSHLFEPFFTTKDKGTGLGLATAYKVVEAMEGKITVQSKKGSGTLIEICLEKYS